MPVENFHGQGYKCLRGNSADTKDILQMLVLLGQNSIRLWQGLYSHLLFLLMEKLYFLSFCLREKDQQTNTQNHTLKHTKQKSDTFLERVVPCIFLSLLTLSLQHVLSEILKDHLRFILQQRTSLCSHSTLRKSLEYTGVQEIVWLLCSRSKVLFVLQILYGL